MKCEIRKSFVKDADNLPAPVQKELAKIIVTIDFANQLSDLAICKKLKGFKTVFRIRLGQYRLGFFFENEIIEIVRFLPRKYMYKIFP